MRINSSINSVHFGAVKSNKKQNKPLNTKEAGSLTPLNQTPTYQIQVPQKYAIIDEVIMPNNLKAHVYKLENGQKVVIAKKEGPTIIKTYVNTGALNEKDEERGISHFVEHSLFNGSDGLKEGEFFETVNKMGANTNASTSFSTTDYYVKSNLLNADDLENQIKIHASMLETPKFTPKMIEKEKGPVTSEISMILDNVENIAVNNTIKNLFNIKSTSEDIIGGTIENINNLNREKVLDYYKQNYYPANMVTVITGDVKESEAIKLVAKYMQSEAPANQNRTFEPLVPIEKTVRSDITSDKQPAAYISIGFKGPENNNVKDHVLFDAVSYILTDSTLSRINKNLEDIQSQACLQIEKMSSKLSDNTALLVGASVEDSKVENAIEKINSSIQSLKTNPPDKDTIEYIKKNLKFDFNKHFEYCANINTILGSAMLDGGLEIVKDYEKIIDNLTPQDFVDFANKYLDTNKQSVTVVHPAKSISFGGRKPLNTNNVEKTVFENNVNLLKNTTDKNVVYADFNIYADLESENPAAILLLSKLLERGSASKSKDDFYQGLEKDGIMMGFSASKKGILSSSAFMKSDTEKALQSFKDVILNPRFTTADFEEVKKQVIQNLKETDVNAKEVLYEHLFENQQKGVSSKSMLSKINDVTLDDVKTLYNKIIVQSQMSSAISGPFGDAAFDNIVSEQLSYGFPDFKKFETVEKSSFKPVLAAKVLTREHNKSQAEIISGYKFKIDDNSPEKMLRYSLLNIILGGTASSRLFNDLRETQKLAYHVKSSLDYNDDDTGVCTLYIKTTTDGSKTYKNLEKSIKGFNNHVEKLLKDGVTEEELKNAKLVFKNRMFYDNETTADKNATLLSNMQNKYGIETTNDVMDLVDNITVEDLKAAAGEIFTNKPVYSIIAKKEALENNKDFLNLIK